MSDSLIRKHRLLVKTNGIRSYLICGYELSKTRLILRTFVEQSVKILDHVEEARKTTYIEIQHLDDDGIVVDTITVKTPILLDWNVDAAWESDKKPLEIKLTYGFNKLD